MLNIQFSARYEKWDDYAEPLRKAFLENGLKVKLAQDLPPEEVDYIIYAPNGPVTDFTPYTKLKAVLNLWAGVEDVVGNETLTVPLCRMVDNGLSEGMTEWVTGHVLRHHLGMDTHIHGQDGVWRAGRVPPLARDRPIGILGLGALGQACGRALRMLNFPVSGWSRSEKNIPDITCHFSDDGLWEVLATSQTLVLLLPLTDATTHILNAETISLMPRGAVIINPGRGPLIDDAALLNALASGQISRATLDVFATEPLPPEHPYWAHPNVTVTPHIASETRVNTAAQVIADNVKRGENGEPFAHVVDRTAGY